MGSLLETKSQGVYLMHAVVCKVQAKNCYMVSLPLVVRQHKEAASLKVKGQLCSCLFIMCVCSQEVRHLIDICNTSVPCELAT